MKARFLFIPIVIFWTISSDAQTTGSTPAPAKSKAALKVNCTPNRNVTGYINLCKELNSLVNCMQQECYGTAAVQTKTNFVLSGYTFTSTQIITISDQNAVVADAKNWAGANQPAGYFTAFIQFIPDIITGPSAAGIDIKVTYKKCTGPNIPKD